VSFRILSRLTGIAASHQFASILKRINVTLTIGNLRLRPKPRGFSVSVLARVGNSVVSARRAECPRTWSPARASERVVIGKGG
jgi:hypothetical protein